MDVDVVFNPLRGIQMGKSTGPRTPGGKARSSKNAAKHFILSKRILSDELEEAAILHSGLEEDLKPQSLIEREMIDAVTLNLLLRRRIDMAFVREFDTALSEKAIELRENRQRAIARYYLRLANGGRDSADSAELAERLRSDRCISALQGLVGRIGDRGPKPEDLDQLHAIYGDQPTEFGAAAIRLLTEAVAPQTEKDEAIATARREDLQKKILDVLQAEIERQENRQELELYQTLTQFASDLQEPFHHSLEKYLRYLTANTKELNNLLDTFERTRHLLGRSAIPNN
jgi:hypothetical protein